MTVYNVFVGDTQSVLVIRWFKTLFYANFILVEVKDFVAFIL